MRRTCRPPRSTVLSPPPPSRLSPEAKGMRKWSESPAEGPGESQESFLVTGQSLVQRGPEAEPGEGSCGLPAAPAPCLLTGCWHPATSRRPCCGALRWARWAASSCPASRCTSTSLPSPWGRTSKVRCPPSGAFPVPSARNQSEPCSSSEFPGLCKGQIQGTPRRRLR